MTLRPQGHGLIAWRCREVDPYQMLRTEGNAQFGLCASRLNLGGVLEGHQIGPLMMCSRSCGYHDRPRAALGRRYRTSSGQSSHDPSKGLANTNRVWSSNI